METTKNGRTHVGIDIGTTSAKICARQGKRVIFELRQNYGSQCCSIQDPLLILRICFELLKKTQRFIDSDLESSGEIDDIWICGQMHGIVMWKGKTISEFPDNLVCSSLFNWMFEYEDDPDFLKTLPNWDSSVYPGFGMATLAYLNKMKPEVIEGFDKCGTIMDLFANILTGTENVQMSQHNAHSWAFCSSDSWNENILSFIPSSLCLPKIVENGTIIGNWLENGKTLVHVPSGDLQASVASISSSFEKNTAFLILGTSAQLCCLVDSTNQNEIYSNLPTTVVKLPYSRNKHLLAACAMNGGNALENILKWRSSDNNLENLLEKLEEKEEMIPCEAEIFPIFIKERGVPMSQEYIFKTQGAENLSDLQLLEATHSGIIRNIFNLFPIDLLLQLNIKNLALLGTARANRFERHIRSQVGDKLQIVKGGENNAHTVSAPYGATNFEL